MKRPSWSHLAETAFGVAGWAAMGLIAVPCWLLVLGLPKLSWRRRVTWASVHALSICLRIPFKVTGEAPAPGEPGVIVANHESILDSFALFGALPGPIVFVAGGDLATHPVTGPFLRRLGAAFVRVDEGMDRSSVRAVLAELGDVARAGERPIFFPEGGLSVEPGLRRFQLGAFVVAGEVGCPVVPVAIVGTRRLLPPGARLPRRSEVEVLFGAPLTPTGPGWREARGMAREARGAIEALLADAPG
ncbi:MAG TPA: lysophospholipid acyltransferase family protein [Acidimicrobiales bacterium]|nr:lysophospholipid acyltransferase family protein [Acidimicrobiales bacterium]